MDFDLFGVFTLSYSFAIYFKQGICIIFYFFYSFLAVFLLNGAAAGSVDILSFVSVGRVVENARLVDVDGRATGR